MNEWRNSEVPDQEPLYCGGCKRDEDATEESRFAFEGELIKEIKARDLDCIAYSSYVEEDKYPVEGKQKLCQVVVGGCLEHPSYSIKSKSEIIQNKN